MYCTSREWYEINIYTVNSHKLHNFLECSFDCRDLRLHCNCVGVCEHSASYPFLQENLSEDRCGQLTHWRFPIASLSHLLICFKRIHPTDSTCLICLTFAAHLSLFPTIESLHLPPLLSFSHIFALVWQRKQQYHIHLLLFFTIIYLTDQTPSPGHL